MKKVTLLSISNSFGVNLQTYAHQIALENGIDLDIYVLYIGGCPLEKHYHNLLANSKDYELFHNGVSTHEFVSILDGLKIHDEWDYIIKHSLYWEPIEGIKRYGNNEGFICDGTYQQAKELFEKLENFEGFIKQKIIKWTFYIRMVNSKLKKIDYEEIA